MQRWMAMAATALRESEHHGKFAETFENPKYRSKKFGTDKPVPTTIPRGKARSKIYFRHGE
jgi:hypothetical protein